MYDWLQRELAEVREPKFHIVDGPADRRLRRAIEKSPLPAPESYKQFALAFGNARLYREDESIDDYFVEVFASMREAETQEGEPLLMIGRHRKHPAYFKPDLMDADAETPVFEWFSNPQGGYMQQSAGGFREWVETCCARARKKYGKRRWAAVCRGPEPFTDDERRIAEARPAYTCRIIGIAKNKNIRFEVHNGSNTTIRYLTIGINHNSEPFGAVFLPVGKIRPGKTAAIEFDCYKDMIPPAEVTIFEYPPLGPEDRDRFWEFKT